MGQSIEIEPEFGGSGMSFIHACLAIEEISKVRLIGEEDRLNLGRTLIAYLFC